MADFPFEGSLMQHHPASFLTPLSACLLAPWPLGRGKRVSKVFPDFWTHNKKVRESKYPGQMFSLPKQLPQLSGLDAMAWPPVLKKHLLLLGW